MPPSATGHPVPDELLAYGDGAADDHVVAHVRGCVVCQQRAADSLRTPAALRRLLYRFDCPDPHTLGEYQFDLLGAPERTRVAGHAADCDECRAELQTLRTYLAAPVRLPHTLLDRAQRVVASVLKPAPGLAYGGLRGGAETATRVFEADDVTVTVGPGPAPSTLIGLVVVPTVAPDELAGSEVRLVPAEGAALQSTIDDLGTFAFSGLRPAKYALEIQLTDTLMVVIEKVRAD